MSTESGSENIRPPASVCEQSKIMSEREHIRVVAVIQARMGSTRLPGKVLKPIAGKPLLWHVLHRLKSCSTLNYTIVATSDNPRDDAIEAFCREEKIEIVRGPEDNVLARFQQ